MTMKKPESRVFYLWLAEAVISSILFFVFVYLFSVVVREVELIYYLIPGLSLVFAVFYMYFRYRAWGFEIRDDHLYLKHGVFRKVESMVPYVRIQHIDSQRSILDRLAGLSKVVVYTAGSRGADVRILGVYPRDAKEMQRKLRDVAIESDERDAV
ncbi:MAG: putative membrane protein YdbS containing bPH2 domain [Candidatus Methanohalarchaeum thermophilum]|uniref:Membrane protein YdbS containing bPH2 domain n=1 Tax=Methanohalarchaeum thermophilum TaxID=1903181 RepID=A0A1Q6DT24_METT1|nr:MAG: putative membrane protein YdbS containing bPH2 domain [Candidatus Methanohalarchaeum thermophilum]